MTKVTVIIPAYNEEDSIGLVLAEIPSFVNEVIVVNNGSDDKTADQARVKDAIVIEEPNKGYGYACLAGMNYIKNQSILPEIVVFLDGDYSDYPEELMKLIKPIQEDYVDFVVGARVKTLREKGAMQPQQIFGNKLATFLMKIIYNSTFTDLGPFRAIRYDKLKELKMEDKTYGWTVEMQLKVLKHKMSYKEIPVHYKKRIGISKVSGTVKGTLMAGYKIIIWILKYSLWK